MSAIKSAIKLLCPITHVFGRNYFFEIIEGKLCSAICATEKLVDAFKPEHSIIFTRFPVYNGCIVTFTGNKSLPFRFSIYSIIYLGSDKSMMKTMTLCTETFLVLLKSINLKSFESSCKDEC
jgi:hypothetical protein